MSAVRIRRGFVDVSAGQAHYRHAAPTKSNAMPLVMIHASPGSSQSLEPLIARFGASRPVFAIDTLGNGDSSPPPGANALSDRPDLSVFVAGHLEAMDALGIEALDLYGSHTGGNIACEIAISTPGRTRHLIIDGMSLYSEAERADMLAHYAPGIDIEADGAHLIRIWNFVRDSYVFWPWYKRGAENLRGLGLPPAETLHAKAIEVLKAASTYHYSYNAAFAYRKEQRLALIDTPTLLACAKSDMLFGYFDQVATLIPRAQRYAYDAPRNEVVNVMCAFLDSKNVAVA